VVDALSQPTTSAIGRLRAALQIYISKGHPILSAAVLSTLKTVGLARRGRQLDRYFREVPPEKRRLSIGAGGDMIDGWLCTDVAPIKRVTVFLDATTRWPMPPALFRYIACEHMIGHVPFDAGLQVISEAHRVLQPGGVLRLSTPNLDVMRLLPDSDDPEEQDYIRWFNRTFGLPAQRADETSPVHTLNLVMHEFGHIYLYDEDTLRRARTQAGFSQIVRCEPNVSRHAELTGVDQHADIIPEAANRVESLILEDAA
jgi:predicted SAM-dependent methyltransferase